MTTLRLIDILAFAWFLTAWLGYSFVIERSGRGRTGLNALMNRHRDEWMMHMLAATTASSMRRCRPPCKTAPPSSPRPA